MMIFDLMFYGCDQIETIEFGDWFSIVAYSEYRRDTMVGMFAGCSNLKTITIGDEFWGLGNGSGSYSGKKGGGILDLALDDYDYGDDE